MREIKFRGRRLDNGEWVYGFYRQYPIFQKCGKCMDHINHFIDYEHNSEFVDPATVGQYTGLKDKNGKEIYEGDIMLTQGPKCRFIQVVEFHNTRETCGRGWVGVNHKTVDNFGHDNPVQGGFSYFPMPCHCEIIGNIHDNPELLKTE